MNFAPLPWYERLAALARTLKQGLLQLLYPNACWACGGSLPPETAALCDACRQTITHDPHNTCPRCSSTVGPFVNLQKGCVHCQRERFFFAAAFRLGPYQGLLKEVVLRMKHWNGEALAESVGELWAEHAEAQFRATGADVVIPIPLHWWRRWRRGYNQSEALARGLAARLGLPVRPAWLRRSRYTPKQTQRKNAGERKQNVRGAFEVRKWADLAGKTVLLVDDVLTTGSTASEAARALRRAGAARVVAAVLAHDRG